MKQRANISRAVNVTVNGMVEATIPIIDHFKDEIDAIKLSFQNVDGAVLTPAKGKVFGDSRHCVKAFVNVCGKWMTR